MTRALAYVLRPIPRGARAWPIQIHTLKTTHRRTTMKKTLNASSMPLERALAETVAQRSKPD